jgi:hypothetical protein
MELGAFHEKEVKAASNALRSNLGTNDLSFGLRGRSNPKALCEEDTMNCVKNGKTNNEHGDRDTKSDSRG